MSELPLSIALPADVVEVIARRAAAIAVEQLGHDAPRRPSKYLSVAEAAELYRCKPQRIYDLLSAGRLTRVREGGNVLLERAELERRLERGGRLVSGSPVP